MTIEVVMRRPQSSDYNSVRALIEIVANETVDVDNVFGKAESGTKARAS
jgi:hypothetical protein